jgi:hypothetical protein
MSEEQRDAMKEHERIWLQGTRLDEFGKEAFERTWCCDKINDVEYVRADQLSTAIRERDEARRECERLKSVKEWIDAFQSDDSAVAIRDLASELIDLRNIKLSYENALAYKDAQLDEVKGVLKSPTSANATLTARVKELEAKSMAVLLGIRHATITHEAVCNGVHADNNTCEGYCLWWQSVDELEAALSAAIQKESQDAK